MARKVPLLSVVVPFRGGSLAPLVESLKGQLIRSRDFELLIVREADCELDSDVFLGCQFDIRVLVYDRPHGFLGHSAGPMRNIAIRCAYSDHLVFVDSDCSLQPDCLNRHAAAICSGEFAVLCGLARELPATTQIDRTGKCSLEELWMLSLRDGRETAGRQSKGSNVISWQDFYTCNASVPRDLAISAGLFDESGYRCHDVDFGYRLSLQGARFHLDEQCQVIHLEHPRSASFRYDQIAGWQWLAQKYPEVSGIAEDKRVILSRSFRRCLGKAEARFGEITRNLAGIRCGRTWLLPPGFTVEQLNTALFRIPFVRRNCSGATELFLRLDKNCWDYSFLLPGTESDVTISVVVPAFNEARAIRRAVESVLRQTNQSFELIIVDDASVDGTVATLKDYFVSKRIRILTNRYNRGLAFCLNRALDACRGAFLLHLDADDWLEPHALETLAELCKANPEIGAVYGAPRVHVTRASSGATSYVDVGTLVSTSVDCLTYSRFQAPRIYRVKALKAIGGWRIDDAFEGRYLEDRLMLATVAQHYRLLFCPEPLYNVKERPESLSRRQPLRGASAKLAILYNQASERQLTLAWSFNGAMVSAIAFHQPRRADRLWSVIIPFRGNMQQLVLSLRSWLDVDVGKGSAEFIVIIDGKDVTLDFSSLPDHSRFRFVQLCDCRGPAASRNMGAKCAKYRNLFFSDADRIVAPNILALHEARHLKAPSSSLVVGDVFGRRTFSFASAAFNTFQRRRLLEITRFRSDFRSIAVALISDASFNLVEKSCASVWRAAQPFSFTDSWQSRWGEILLQYGENLTHFPHRWLRVGAGSLSMNRDTFETIGGFDENFKVMEDWELGIRAQKADCTIICAPEAESLHQVHIVSQQRLFLEAASARQLAKKHPDIIKDLRMGTSAFIPPGGAQFRSPYFAHD